MRFDGTDTTDSETERPRNTSRWVATPTKSSWGTNSTNGWNYSSGIRYSSDWLLIGVPVVREETATDVTVEQAISLPGHMKLKKTQINLPHLLARLKQAAAAELDKKNKPTALEIALANTVELLQPLQVLADSRQLAIQPIVEFSLKNISSSGNSAVSSPMHSPTTPTALSASSVADSLLSSLDPMLLPPTALPHKHSTLVTNTSEIASSLPTQALYYARGENTEVTALLPFIHRHHSNATTADSSMEDQGFYVTPLPVAFGEQAFTAKQISEGFSSYIGAICLLGYTVEGYCSGKNPVQASVPIIKHSLAANLPEGTYIASVKNSAQGDNAYELALFEHTQSFAFETITRTHRADIKPTYYIHLPWLDYGIHALQLYTKEKISPTAIGQYLTLARNAKLNYEARLKTMGERYDVDVVCLSPFDNLLSGKMLAELFDDYSSINSITTSASDSPKSSISTTQSHIDGDEEQDPLLEDERIGKLFIKQILDVVDGVQPSFTGGDAEYRLVQTLLPKLKDIQRASNPTLAATWQEVLANMNEADIKSIDDLFHLANTVFVLYSNRSNPGHACSLLPLSEFSIYTQTEKLARAARMSSRLAKVNVQAVLTALELLTIQPRAAEKVKLEELLQGKVSLSGDELALVKTLIAFHNRAQLLQQTDPQLIAKKLGAVLNKTIAALSDPNPSKGLRPFLEEYGIELPSALSKELDQLLRQAQAIQKALALKPGDDTTVSANLLALGQALAMFLQPNLLQHMQSEHQRATTFCQTKAAHTHEHGDYRSMCFLITVDPVVTVGKVPNMFNAKDIEERGLITFMQATLTTLRINIARCAQGQEPISVKLPSRTKTKAPIVVETVSSPPVANSSSIAKAATPQTLRTTSLSELWWKKATTRFSFFSGVVTTFFSSNSNEGNNLSKVSLLPTANPTVSPTTLRRIMK